MSIFIPATLTRTLHLGTFDTVCQLLQQMAQLPGALLLSEDAIAPTDTIAAQLPQRFTLFVSEQFSALLWAQAEGEISIKAGADDYLTKPVQPEELLHKITNLLMANG